MKLMTAMEMILAAIPLEERTLSPLTYVVTILLLLLLLAAFIFIKSLTSCCPVCRQSRHDWGQLRERDRERIREVVHAHFGNDAPDPWGACSHCRCVLEATCRRDTYTSDTSFRCHACDVTLLPLEEAMDVAGQKPYLTARLEQVITPLSRPETLVCPQCAALYGWVQEPTARFNFLRKLEERSSPPG